MVEMVSDEWLRLALEIGDVPEAPGTSSHRDVRWQARQRSVRAHALDERTVLATFLEHAGRQGSPSNVIRRYRSSRSDLDLFLDDVRAFFAVGVSVARG